MHRFFVDKVKNLDRPVRSKKPDRFQLCPTPSPTHPHPKIAFESEIGDFFVSLDITFILLLNIAHSEMKKFLETRLVGNLMDLLLISCFSIIENRRDQKLSGSFR